MLPTDLHQELQELAAESIGWIPLGEGVYLHVADEKAAEIEVVGLARADMQSSNVVWVV